MTYNRKTSDKKNEIIENFMTYVNEGLTLSEIAEKFEVSYSYIYWLLDDISKFHNVSKEHILNVPSQVYKKIGTLSRELLKLKSDVISKKHEIENSSKIDFSLINDNSSHKNDQLTKLRERIKSSKDNKFLENLMQELNFSIISYKTERANLLSEITLILDALNYYLDIFNKIEGNITSCEDSLSEFTLNLDFSNLEN